MHDIAGILLKLMLKTNQSVNQAIQNVNISHDNFCATKIKYTCTMIKQTL